MNVLTFEKILKNLPSNILISRPDSLGDVTLALPVAKVLKDFIPHIKIGFIGKSYTRALVETCMYVDEYINEETFMNEAITICGEKPECIIHVLPKSAIASRAKELEIPLRIGTTNRVFHWFTCNRLIKLSRKNSLLHEAQLNLKLLEDFTNKKVFSLKEIAHSYGLKKLETLSSEFASLLQPQKYNIILHPKSQGNGREWPLENFIQLIHSLDKQKYNIFISGTKKDQIALQPLLNEVGNLVTDITGKMELSQFISFINECDGLVASSTGPIHIAAALGKDALGLYVPIRPLDYGRWGPVGVKAKAFAVEKNVMLAEAIRQRVFA